MESPTLSETYWRLHRNSLASSSLLFLASNSLIEVEGWQALKIHISLSLLQVFLLIWATYAISVLYFEGSREENINSNDFLENIRTKNKILKEIFDKFSATLSFTIPRIETLVRNIEASLKFATSQERLTELISSSNEIASSLDGLKIEISKIEALAAADSIRIKHNLYSDRLRRFLSGIGFPSTIFGISFLHFVGFYFPICASLLDIVKITGLVC